MPCLLVPLSSLAVFVTLVGMFNICDRPPQIKRHEAPAVKDDLREASDVHRKLAAINVPFLNNFYGIPTNKGQLHPIIFAVSL